MHLHDFLDRAAEATPDAPAVHHAGHDTSYRELAEQSRRLAAMLSLQGLAPGARVAAVMPNHPAFFSCHYGVHRTPYVWLALNPRSALDEIIDTLVDFDAQWLFTHSDFAPHWAAIRARVPRLKGCVSVDAAFDGVPDLGHWLAAAPDAVPPVAIGPLDCVALRTTGGSTGKPKGVMRTSLSYSLILADYFMALPFRSRPVNLVLTPLSHAAGEVAMPVFSAGGTQVLLHSTRPDEILAAIQRHRATMLFVPPTLVYMLLAHPDIRSYDLSSLEYVVYGSAPMSVQKLREAWEVFGPVLAQVYGLSEASSTLSIMSPAEHAAALQHRPERIASCGRGGPMYRIRVVDAEGRELAPFEKGEIVCRGDHLMKGYFGDDDATAQAIRGGWLHTGDVGYKDEAGYVYIVDRKKDLIISGGFNVYPGEVEQVIFQHPAVKDCSVIGVPDEKWGEAVTAVVEVKPGATLDTGALLAQCRSKLGSVKAPKQILVWPTLPRSPAGKVLKKDIRLQFWQHTGRSI